MVQKEIIKRIKFALNPIKRYVEFIDQIIGSFLNNFVRINPDINKKDIAIISHRGSDGPENTISAFRNSLKNKRVKGIECDIVFTKDCVPVVAHHYDFSKEVPKSKRPVIINQMNLKDIKNLDIGINFSKKYKGEKIPTLREALKFLKGKVNKIYLHDKAENKKKEPKKERERIQSIVKEIKESYTEKLVVIMIESGDLTIWNDFSKEISMLLCWSGTPWQKDRKKIEYSINKGMKYIGFYDGPNQLKFPGNIVSRMGFKNIGHFIGFWPNKKDIEKFLEKGYEFVVFTLNDKLILKQYINAGFKYIGTDNISSALEVLKE